MKETVRELRGQIKELRHQLVEERKRTDKVAAENADLAVNLKQCGRARAGIAMASKQLEDQLKARVAVLEKVPGLVRRVWGAR